MKVNQIITALLELEDKGCHDVYFEYENSLFRVRIIRKDTNETVYEKTVSLKDGQGEMNELSEYVENLRLSIYSTVNQCYKREFVKGVKAGKWEKCKPFFEVGANSMTSTQLGGLGKFIDDPDNHLQYFEDMKYLSETD
jgi:hypothetical protein